jgi:ribose transport system ATP-binding protein
MCDLLVSMKGIDKSFPGVKALDKCQFELYKGEVHALVGENGAGKSTLMKVLTGIYQKDDGKILYKGKEIHLKSPKDARDIGIGIIHQEINLMPNLTVAENIFIGREYMKGPLLDIKKTKQEAVKLMEILGLQINPEIRVQDLTIAKQQMVEIVKVLSLKTEVLIMDEPTAALTDSEINELFRFIRDLKKQGVGIIYISHRMDEMKQISDRISIMRDGQYVGTVNTKETTIDRIIQMMIGRVIYEEHKTDRTVSEDAPIVMSCENLSSPVVKDVSFELKKGEILGFAGLMGAGRTETCRLIFGADQKSGGEIYINGKKVHINSPFDAVRQGIAYLSEDRKRYGLALGLSVTDNSILATVPDFIKGGLISDKKANKVTAKFVDRISIKTPSKRQLLKNLSGGNQQKVVLVKWLIKNCDILIFDEPTRGIDVGTKSEIYKLMNELVHEGKSVIMISSELPELLRMSDRIAVMCEGVITGFLDIKDATREKIMQLATQRRQ